MSIDLETDSISEPDMACSIVPGQTLVSYDAAIAYTEEDYEEAKQAMVMMNNIDLGNGCRPKVCLYDNPQFSPNSIKRTCCVVKHCLFVFCLLTENTKKDNCLGLFIEEAIGITQFQSCGNCGNPPTSVQRKNCSVRPLHTQPEKTRVYPTPLGLTTISGFDLKNTNVKDRLKEFFDMFKNEKRHLFGCAESPKSSASERSASSRTASRSALALPEDEVSLNSNQIPRISALGRASHVTSLELAKESNFPDGKNREEKEDRPLKMRPHEISADGYASRFTSELELAREPNLEEKEVCRIMSRAEMYQDSAYHSESASAYPSIFVSRNRNQGNETSNSNPGRSASFNTELTEPEPPMESKLMENGRKEKSKSLPNSYSYSEIMENGRLVCFGNGSRSCKSLADSALLPMPMKKKPLRKPKPQKKFNLFNCNVVQIAMQPNGNSRNGISPPQNMEEDSDSEWSNEEPTFKNVAESNKQTVKNASKSNNQDSAEKTMVPSDSTAVQSNGDQPNGDQSNGDQSTSKQTFNFDLSSLNDNLKTTIEESNDSRQQSMSTENSNDSAASGQSYQDLTEEKSYYPLRAACDDSHDDNPQDHLQAINYSTSPTLLDANDDAQLVPCQEAVDSSTNPSLFNSTANAEALDSREALQQVMDILDPESLMRPNQLPHEKPSSSPCQEAEKVLSREEPLSMGSMGQENIEDAGGRSVPLAVAQDQLGFIRGDENHSHKFSQPGTFPFSYHSLHSNHWSNRQMSFMNVALLTRVYQPPSIDELD